MTGHGGHHGPSDAERAFFERLLQLRRRYASRTADDAVPIIGLQHAMARANEAMRDLAQGRMHLGISGN